MFNYYMGIFLEFLILWCLKCIFSKYLKMCSYFCILLLVICELFFCVKVRLGVEDN